MEDYLKSMIEPLLANREDLVITKSADERGILLAVDVNKNDIGRVIGKQGQTIKAIRLLCHVFGTLNNATISIKINEPVGGRYA